MTHEICPAQCLAYTTSLNRLTHFFQALEFEFYGCSHSTLVSKRPSLVSFSPLDYNCLKDQGSFSCIFVIPAHSTVPGAEMLHAHLLRWGTVLLVRLVDTHTVLFRPEFLTPILTALACYSNDFATLAYCTRACYCPLRCPCSVLQEDSQTDPSVPTQSH